jgi:hypothetical protein
MRAPYTRISCAAQMDMSERCSLKMELNLLFRPRNEAQWGMIHKQEVKTRLFCFVAAQNLRLKWEYRWRSMGRSKDKKLSQIFKATTTGFREKRSEGIDTGGANRRVGRLTKHGTDMRQQDGSAAPTCCVSTWSALLSTTRILSSCPRSAPMTRLNSSEMSSLCGSKSSRIRSLRCANHCTTPVKSYDRIVRCFSPDSTPGVSMKVTWSSNCEQDSIKVSVRRFFGGSERVRKPLQE